MTEQEHPIRPLTARQAVELQWLRRWSHLMDSAFRIPGTSLRWGWDPIVGLIPGLGDAVTPLFSCFVIYQAFRLGIPRLVQLRMLMNVAIDLVVGAIPLFGDVFDFAWKSNDMNVTLLERHAAHIRKPGPGDWLFVGAVLAILLMCALLPVLLLAWFLEVLGRAWIQAAQLL
jgi:hypothetical protein